MPVIKHLASWLRPGKNALAVFAAQVWGRLLSLVLAAIIARQAGTAALGTYILVLTLVSVTSGLTDLGLGTLLTREIARTQENASPKNQRALLSSFFWLKLCLSLGGYLLMVGLAGSGLFPRETAGLLRLGGLVLVPDAISGTWGAYFNGRQRMEIPSGITAFNRALALGSGLYALGHGLGLAGVLLAAVFASLCGALLHTAVLLRWRLFPLFGPRVSQWQAVVLEAFPFALTSVIAAVYTRLDLVLLGLWSGNLAAGWYGAAYKLWDAASLVPNSILNALFPEITRLWSTPAGREKLRRRFQAAQMGAFAAGIALAAGGTALAEPLLSVFFGIETARPPAVWTFRLLVWALPAMFLYLLNGYWLYAAQRQVRVTLAMGFVAVFNLVLNVLLIPRWSYLGAAAVALGSEWLLWVLLHFQVRRLLYADPNTFPTGGYISAQVTVADLDGDGQPEIIAGSDALYACKQNGVPLAGFPAHGSNFFASRPAVGDFDGDGQPEILVGCDDDALYTFDRMGRLLPGWPVRTGGDVYSSPVLFPLPGKPGLGVIVGSDDGCVYAWDAAGHPLPGWPEQTQGFVSASPVLVDLDGDGQLEVVTGSWNRHVYAWKLDGTPLAGWPQETGHFVWSGAAVGDLLGEGTLDVVAASDQVYAWDAKGSLIPGWPQQIGSYSTSKPVLGDLDGDGRLEVVVGADRLYAWRSDGTTLPGFPLDLGTFLWSAPELGDVDGDGLVEIVMGGWDGQVYVIASNGTINMSFTTRGPIFAAPTLADLDNDGKMEILIGSWDERVYLFRCPPTGWLGSKGSNHPSRKHLPKVLQAGSFSQVREFQAPFVAFPGSTSTRAVMYYRAHFENVWHPVPLVVHRGSLTGLIQPFLKETNVQYYAEIKNKTGIQRIPEKDFFTYQVSPDWAARLARRLRQSRGNRAYN